MTLTASDTITNTGAVSSEGSLTTTAGLFTNSGSVSAASITVSGKDVINQGSIDKAVQERQVLLLAVLSAIQQPAADKTVYCVHRAT